MPSTTDFPPEPLVLTGRHVVLQPLSLAHLDEILEAGADPDVWRWLPHAYFLDRDLARQWIEDAVAEQTAKRALPFAIIDAASGRAAGSTRMFDFRPDHKGLEIGWTWLGAPYQRTAINTECKRLLLGFAFEQLDALRVQLKTDSRNTRSRAAIERMGASFEGVLRNHMLLPNGDLRHSAFFSVLADEWPTTRQRLDSFLEQAP